MDVVTDGESVFGCSLGEVDGLADVMLVVEGGVYDVNGS